MKCVCKSDLPYPEIKVECKNKYYANLLLDDYAGSVSETTAVFVYIYQHIIEEHCNEEISDILKKIAIIEMKHLDLLGETICLLGCDPCFRSSSINDFWNANNINYTTNIKEILKNDILAETKAINQYIKHRDIINDKYIKRTINRILDDEYVHINCFKSLYNSIIH